MPIDLRWDNLRVLLVNCATTMRPLLSAVLIMLVLPGVAGAEIYRWVDAQGRVHFGERPLEGAQRLEVQPQIVERDDQVRQREANLQRLVEVRSQERALDWERLARDRERQEAVCQDLRTQLARFDQRVFWYQVDGQGRQIEVPRAQVEARRAEIQNLVQERC